MLASLSCLLIFLALLSSNSACAKLQSPSHFNGANARRMAVGLPPLPPVKRWDATRVQVHKRTGASPLPPIPMQGRVAMYRVDSGSFLGYLTGVGNTYYANTNTNTAAKFTITASPLGTTNLLNLQDITSTNYFGAFISEPTTLSSSTTVYVPFGRLQSAAPPGNKDAPGETAIWIYDASTSALSPQYENPDGSLPTTLVMYAPAAYSFVLTANPGLTNKGVLVTFKFVII